MEDLENEGQQPNGGSDIKPSKPWQTQRAELMAEKEALEAALRESQEALTVAENSVQLMKSNGVNKGAVQILLSNWADVDYSKSYISVKMSVKDGSGRKVPADGDFRLGKGPVFKFRDGRCVTNLVKEMREFLKGRSGYSTNRVNILAEETAENQEG